MYTIQDIINQCRLDLGDASTNVVTGSAIIPRYPDADLLKFANAGIYKALAVRPDLNFGAYGGTWVDLVATSSFPLPIEYLPAIVGYVTHRNQSGDDAFVNNGKADKGLITYLKDLGVG